MIKEKTYPLMPLLNTVVYPRIVVPLAVGRPASLAVLQAVEEAGKDEQHFIVVAQKDPEISEPGWGDLYEIGTLVAARRIERIDSRTQVVVQGIRRVFIKKKVEKKPCFYVQVDYLSNPEGEGLELQALIRENQELALKIANLMDPENGNRMYEQLIGSIKDPLVQAYRMASLASIDVHEQQKLLEIDGLFDLLTSIYAILLREQQIAKVRLEIASKTKNDMEQQQREAVLRQQKRAIESALGEDSLETEEASELRKRLQQTKGLPVAVQEEVEREIKRMERMSSSAADFQITRTYIELILELPWSEATEDRLDINHANEVLEKDHFSLEDIKERILEHLSVMQMNPEAKAPILCFVGPPGVGKTSLGQSIARSLGRKFERLSLGGLHDEAELRGHRRTYVGAMPGRILQAIRRAGVKNPLLMLDEIDKLGHDFRGDPSAALMEILDPVQNASFVDNYLNLPFDLSKIFFITTANSLESIPRPLLDRMEILELSGYSDYEKREIATRYLIPRQRKEAGLSEEQLNIAPEALDAVVQRYTREAGVRELERTIASLARKQTRHFLEKKEVQEITLDNLSGLLGPGKFFPEKTRKNVRPGVATGLAWTYAGGDIIYIEAALIAKNEKLHLTGQLGDVMKESVQAARSYLWGIAPDLGIEQDAIEGSGVHVHVPAGGVPKDGPSAGATIATALASLYSGCAVRSGLAITGEIALTGLILPVGGIKEKVLAAHRAGLRKVILPRTNEHDLVKLPDHVSKDIQFILADNLIDVFRVAIPDLYLRPVVAA